jgi:hypothetical protein
MTDQALEEVDWDSHTMAVGRSQLSQPFLVKILPVGMLIHRYDPVKYTIDCPTCRKHIGFFRSVLVCTALVQICPSLHCVFADMH